MFWRQRDRNSAYLLLFIYFKFVLDNVFAVREWFNVFLPLVEWDIILSCFKRP